MTRIAEAMSTAEEQSKAIVASFLESLASFIFATGACQTARRAAFISALVIRLPPSSYGAHRTLGQD